MRCDRSFAADLHGSRLTARGRAAVAAAWLVLVALATVPVVRAEIPATPPSADTTIEVLPGDTLWGIARSLDPDADPRDVVDEITRLNGLGAGAYIRPGDVLVVPDGRATR